MKNDNNAMSDGLLPCPFCGGEAEYSEKQAYDWGCYDCWISCKSCGSKGRVIYKDYHDKSNAKQIAISAWNTRAAQEKADVDSKEIIEKLLNDITDRRGWRQEWDGFDDEVKQEIRDAFAGILAPYLRTTQSDIVALRKMRCSLESVLESARADNPAMIQSRINSITEALAVLKALIRKAGD